MPLMLLDSPSDGSTKWHRRTSKKSGKQQPPRVSCSSSIHGNKSQPQRQRALAQFEAGQVTTLVATDVAARGIDVADVTQVINFDAPPDRDTYVHRVGRTGRAGRDGAGVSFVLAEQRHEMRRIAADLGLSREFERSVSARRSRRDAPGAAVAEAVARHQYGETARIVFDRPRDAFVVRGDPKRIAEILDEEDAHFGDVLNAPGDQLRLAERGPEEADHQGGADDGHQQHEQQGRHGSPTGSGPASG